MGTVSIIGGACKTSDQCSKDVPFSYCDNGQCRCENGFATTSNYNQCAQTVLFGHVCESHRSCRLRDEKMNCDPTLKRCLCAYTHVFDEASQICQYKIPNICPTGYKWNVRVGDCEGRGRHRGSDKMIDVIIVFVFFVILLLVIRKWKPSYQGLDRDLSWPLRRETPATVLFISAARPSIWSSSSDNEPQGHPVPTLPPAPPQYNSLAESNIFEPREPPPTYEEAMNMATRSPCPGASAKSGQVAVQCTFPDSGGTAGTGGTGGAASGQSGPMRPPLGRRDSDDPFEV